MESVVWHHLSPLGGSVAHLPCNRSPAPDWDHVTISESRCRGEGGLGDTGGHVRQYPGCNARQHEPKLRNGG